MEPVPDEPTSTPEAERLARELLAEMDPTVGVGSKHHTVPRFMLDRFSRDGRLLVRDRSTGAPRGVRVTDLAIRDFYSVLDLRGSDQLDGTIEQLLSRFESAGAMVIQRLLQPPPPRLSAREMFDLALLLGFQMVRGPRRRAEVELMAEYWAKAHMSTPGSVGVRHEHTAAVRRARRAGRTPSRGNGGWKPKPRRRPSDAELRGVRVRPDPQAHISTMVQATELGEHLFVRPVTVVELDRPLLLVGDEPVVILGGSESKHLPECFMTPDEHRRADRRALKRGQPRREVVHMTPTRASGIEDADAVAMPLAPDRLLLLGAKDQPATARLVLTGTEADEAADDVNGRIVDQSFLWIAGHPEHATLRNIVVPPRGPLFTVCGRDTAAVSSLASAHASPLVRIRDSLPRTS